MTQMCHLCRVVGNNLERREYKEDGIIEAVREYTESVKDAREKKEYGTLAATFVFHGGKVKEIIIQTNVTKMY